MYGKNREKMPPSNNAKADDCGKLCFWLGFCLWLLGILIAAIIGKAEGVMRAVKGLLCSVLIVAVLYALLGVTFAFLRRTSSDGDFYLTKMQIMMTGISSWAVENRQVPKSFEQVRDSTYDYFNKKTERTEKRTYLDAEDLVDPWGSRLKMKVDSKRIGKNYSVKITLRSAGPDGEFKTDDDLLAEDSFVVFPPEK